MAPSRAGKFSSGAPPGAGLPWAKSEAGFAGRGQLELCGTSDGRTQVALEALGVHGTRILNGYAAFLTSFNEAHF